MTDPLEILDRLQADVKAILAAVPALAAVAVLGDDEGDIESDVLKNLGPLNAGETDKRGLCAVVLAPECQDAEPGSPGPLMRARIDIQFIENVTINRGSGGTGLKCGKAAACALNALQHQVLGWTALHCGEKPIVPVKIGRKGIISRMVSMYTAANLPPNSSKCAAVVPQTTGNALELSCATQGAAIWYTTDGSYPSPANTAAILYEGPILGLDSGTTVRAAAYATALNPGDCDEFAVTGFEPITWATLDMPWNQISTPWNELG